MNDHQDHKDHQAARNGSVAFVPLVVFVVPFDSASGAQD
jgi:hypothetical protein